MIVVNTALFPIKTIFIGCRSSLLIESVVIGVEAAGLQVIN